MAKKKEKQLGPVASWVDKNINRPGSAGDRALKIANIATLGGLGLIAASHLGRMAIAKKVQESIESAYGSLSHWRFIRGKTN